MVEAQTLHLVQDRSDQSHRSVQGLLERKCTVQQQENTESMSVSMKTSRKGQDLAVETTWVPSWEACEKAMQEWDGKTRDQAGLSEAR